MEQYLLQAPKHLAAEIRAQIAQGNSENIELVSKDNQQFTFSLNGKQYHATVARLPCVLETHKTYDNNFFYKSGEIGQIFLVTDQEQEQKAMESLDTVPNGITPPNTNVVKRKYEKTRHYAPFPKAQVARVEEDLIKIIQGGPFEEIQEEIVDFHDWMVDDAHPEGIVVTDELELIRKHPEYLYLTSEDTKSPDSVSNYAHTSNNTAPQTPIITDIRSEPVSPFVPNASPDALFQDVEDLENELLDGMEFKLPAITKDPAYIALVRQKESTEKAIAEAERTIEDLEEKIQANANIVVKNRFRQMMETAQSQKQTLVQALENTKERISGMESEK